MPSYALALPQVGVGAERRHHRRALGVRDGEDLTPPAVVEEEKHDTHYGASSLGLCKGLVEQDHSWPFVERSLEEEQKVLVIC